MLFSKEFNVQRSDDDDWFDPILESDTELFIDPFLIFKEETEEWEGAHDRLITHFNRVFELLARSSLTPASPYYVKATGLLLFPEPDDFCLGYTARGTRGSGGGLELAREIARGMVAAIERGIERLDHFELLGIFNTGIGPDRISDLTCTLLKGAFIDYTVAVAERHGIETSSHTVTFAGAEDDQWLEREAQLPTNPFKGGPVLLVPKRFLRRLPTLNADDWWRWHGIKADLNIEVLEGADKAEIVRQARAHRESVDEWTKEKEDEPPAPYDVDRDHELVWKWESLTLSWVARNPLDLLPFRRVDRFHSLIDHVVEQYRQFIENEAGWQSLWNDDGTEKHERAAQNLFRGIAKHYCHANDISLDREVNLGRGPVDFKFSQGRHFTAHLEVKKLHNGAFWHGLHTQLPVYMRSDEVKDGWLLAVQLRDGGVSDKRKDQLPAEVEKAAADNDLNLRYALVDGRPQDAASTA